MQANLKRRLVGTRYLTELQIEVLCALQERRVFAYPRFPNGLSWGCMLPDGRDALTDWGGRRVTQTLRSLIAKELVSSDGFVGVKPVGHRVIPQLTPTGEEIVTHARAIEAARAVEEVGG